MTTSVQIPCCLCGTMIIPNAANQCSTCLAQQFDLKSILQQGSNVDGLHVIHQCRQCRRFARTPVMYQYCEPESPELMQIALKHVPVLSNASKRNLHVVDAIWVWTEPHSRRLKIRLTIRTEIERVQVQQRVMVEFKTDWKMCSQCNREYTNRTWQAMVQLRQHRNIGAPRKGLLALEMAIARSPEVRRHVLRINSCRNGLDFYFLTLPQAQAFGQFLSRLAPMKIKTSQKLVSEDSRNNTANIKHTITCDMVPICRDDLVVVHKTARNSKFAGRLCLTTKVSSTIHMVDASPTRDRGVEQVDVGAEPYYKVGGEKAYAILFSAERLVRFVVLDVELCDEDPHNSNIQNGDDNDDASQLYQGPGSGVSKYALADVQVARESDFGVNDVTFSCVSHLGHLLQPGDVVLGYDLQSCGNIGISSSVGVVDVDEVVHNSVVMPDVVLVKKVNPKKENADIEASYDDDGLVGQEQEEEDTPMTANKKKRASKKKLRRDKKQDRRRKELEESAARMGFVDDMNDLEDPGFEDGEELADDVDFSSQLENDPELAAELESVERQLASMRVPIHEEEEEEAGGDGDGNEGNRDATTETSAESAGVPANAN
eukprot:CAMPEP_0119549374 /NCGR_PEP_ID=MMETSP1352-20130426/3082_1 /TAXON_ID=265584 /ORGANISM="Stauroneis constricta, Strain CCMP1120" /LENGTH=600 /DNA_ID=CAMNT_0007594907 /DNA_START=115 /DNA_END=1917 /DNA_ORIENTATION=-